MNKSPVDMFEVTRLTREGKLAEAMAILRGASSTTGSTATQDSSCGPYHLDTPAANIVDMVPPSEETGTAWTTRFLGDNACSAPREKEHDFLAPFGTILNRSPKRTSFIGLAGTAGRGLTPEAAHLPAGARFEERKFSNHTGNLAYKLYVPSRYNGETVPLVIMLHGCTQSPDDFAAGTRMNELAEEQMFLVAYPAQVQSANASKCWNWFSESHQRRDIGEPSLIAGITRQIIRDFSVATGRVYVAGLSAGGAAAVIMGTAYPELYAAVGVHSGLACGAARDMPSAFSAMRDGGKVRVDGAQNIARLIVPTIVFHGDGDRTVNPINGDQVILQSKRTFELRKTVSHGKVPGGLSYTRTIHVDGTDRSLLEHWILHGAGHAWSGGSVNGSYTEPRGPNASREMIRFFLQHQTTGKE